MAAEKEGSICGVLPANMEPSFFPGDEFSSLVKGPGVLGFIGYSNRVDSLC